MCDHPFFPYFSDKFYLDLVAYGAQDVILTGEPVFSREDLIEDNLANRLDCINRHKEMVIGH